MEKLILSLKNIYKLLMNTDFPLYSESVISKKHRKGQTLLRFWQDMLVPEFRCLPYGKLIWRNDGTRNRYISNLCNRNDELKYYHEYAQELGSQITPDVLLNQVRRFAEFLQDREYKGDVLRYRVRMLMQALEEDSYVSAPIREQVAGILSAAEQGRPEGVRGGLFRESYLMTVLTMYAAAGEAMNDPAMAALRDQDMGMDALWERFCQRRKKGSGAVRILTAYAGHLQGNPLPKDRFFGREEALFDLREMAAQGKKCLISGIGGVGKTEMLRQLIRQCCEGNVVDKLAIVQYQADLTESLSYAFPALRQQNREETFQVVMHRLEKEAQDGKLLLLLDNVTNETDTDSNLLRLGQLPCAVMLTTRRKLLEGFEAYELTAPPLAASSLIFRDNFGRPLSEEDRQELEALLQHEEIRLPLPLRLMARAAQSKNWSVKKLREHLTQDGIALTWLEDDRLVRIERIYTQLYSLHRVPQACQAVTELFTILPHSSFSVDFLLDVFHAAFPEEGTLRSSLELLAKGGWLERDDSGYSMHPLIAQCLRRKTLPQAYLEKYLSGLHQKFSADRSAEQDREAHMRVSQILVCFSYFLTGSISAKRVLDIMDAMFFLVPPHQQAQQYQAHLQQLLRRCPDRDDTVDLVWHALMCFWGFDDADTAEAVFRRQKTQQTVPNDRFYEFCMYACKISILAKRPELAKELCQTVLEADAVPRLKADAYLRMYAVAEYYFSAEEALHWGRIAVEYTTQHPECGRRQVFNCTSALTNLYLKFGQAEQARSLLGKMKELEEAIALPIETCQYLQARGTYELYYGDLETAREAIQESLRLMDELFGKNLDYYATLNQLAIILQRQKRYHEAMEAYQQILAYGNEYSYYTIARNNYAVLLLDMGRPEEAMPQLAEVLKVARQQGGIALGESLRNMARAHGLLGNHSQERECLLEAVPLLREAYGAEHPRTQASEARLGELANITV